MNVLSAKRTSSPVRPRESRLELTAGFLTLDSRLRREPNVSDLCARTSPSGINACYFSRSTLPAAAQIAPSAAELQAYHGLHAAAAKGDVAKSKNW